MEAGLVRDPTGGSSGGGAMEPDAPLRTTSASPTPVRRGAAGLPFASQPRRAAAFGFLAVLGLAGWFRPWYVQKVPLAAEMLDVRRSQKLKMIKDLNIEKARFRFEVEIGKYPPLSDEEFWSELREKAIELRDEWRLENRQAFANIWSDMVYGVALFLLMYFNQSKVAMLKFTGYKLLHGGPCWW